MYKYLFILLVMLPGCKDREEKPAAPKPGDTGTMVTLSAAQFRNGSMVTGTPQRRIMEATLRVNGLVDVPPQNFVTISFPFGGYIQRISLLPGMHVRKGQVLAVVADESFVQMQQDFLTAQVRLAYLQKEFERQRLLNATKTTSDKVFEQTTSDFQAQRIMLGALHEKLLLMGIDPGKLSESNISRTVNVLAPITGYVSSVNVNTGKYINPTDVLLELVNPNDLHLALTVFEQDLLSIHPGQRVKAWLVSDTARTYDAEVMLVGRTLDSSRSTQVHCHFTGKTPVLSPGMFMNADIQLTSKSVLTVPGDAVVRSGNREFVFVNRKDSVFEMIPVITGASKDGFIAVDPAGQDIEHKVIITANAYAALMKMKNTGTDE